MTAARVATSGSELPRLVDPDEEAAVVEVLIAEARAWARRRRRWSAVAALLAVVGCLVVVFSGRSGAPADRPSVDSPALPGPAVPVAPGAASIVAAEGLVHLGWVIVYDDGRVIGHHDSAPRMLERHLTGAALDLVRSGDLEPMKLMLFPNTPLPQDIWVDSTFQPYEPPRYAACPIGPDAAAPTPIRGVLPAAVQALLRGREHSYPDVGVLGGRSGGPIPVTNCSELSVQETAVLIATLVDAGFSDFHRLNGGPMTCGTLGTSTEVRICVNAVLPHGSWVLWGG